MAKTTDLMDDEVDANEAAGLMDRLGMGDEDLGPCPCCNPVPKPRYQAGTVRARRAASSATAFILETEDDGDLYVTRGGYAFRLEEDGSARERVGRVRDFIDVPLKITKPRKKPAKKA